MKTLKTSLLTLAITFISIAAFSQKKPNPIGPIGIKITKPVSPADLAQVKAILQTFDPNSYTFTIVTTDNEKYVHNAKGLESVSQITRVSNPSADPEPEVVVGKTVATDPTPDDDTPLRSANLVKLSAILTKYK